ncbi:LPXTG cell wall anchor domain-containing protein, partial [Lacticaseibacillus manihotivorans]
RFFSRQPAGVQTTKKDYFETQITHDPDGGTTTTKTNGDGDITTIDKDWGDGDHSHVDIDTGTGIAKITETPKGGSPSEPITVQPGESGKNGTTTLDNGEPDGNIVLTHQGTDGDKTTETITPDTSRSFSRQPGGVSTDASHYYETQITHDPDGGTTTTKTNGDGDITTIDKDWRDGDHSHVDINTETGIATITETPNGGEAGTPVEVQPGESGENGKTTLDNGEPDGNIVLTHQGTDGDKTTETITPGTSRSFSRQPGGVSTTSKDYFETQITHDPDGGTTTTKTNGDGDITTIDKDWSDGDHSHIDIDTDTGIATITETPNGGEAGTPVEVQPGESGENGKTTLDNGEPDGNIVLTHQGTDGDKTTETITPDTSRSFSRQPGGVSTDASHYFETQITHDPDGGTTTTKTNGDGDITTIDKDWGDGDHSHVDIDTDTGIATITETPNGGEAGTPVEVQPGESGKNGKTTLDNGEPDGNIVLTHQGTDGDKTTETITPDTSRSFSRQPGGVSTDASHYYETQVTHDPDGGTTTTKTNGDGDITTIDKNWGDGDHSHVEIDTDTGVATITETPNGGEAGTPVEVQPGESGKNGKTTLDNGEPDGNLVLTHQGTDGDKTTETITPDTSRSFSRMPAPVVVTAEDYYDTRITHDVDGGTTTTVTNGNGDVTTIDKDWGDGSHTHVTVDPNTGDVTATDTDENGNTSTPVTVKPGETGTTGQTTITNGRPDGDIILSHEGTDGDQVEAAISDDGHVRVSLPDTDAEAKAETNVTVTSTSGSTTSANRANLSQTSATSRTDVQGKKPSTTQLPETGDKQNGLGLIGATLLAGLAMLGFGKRRRDDED